MSQAPHDIRKLSADKLLSSFTEARFVRWVVLAIVIHVVVLAGTSTSYMMDLVNPSRVEARKQAEQARRQQALEASRPPQPTTAPAATQASDPATAATQPTDAQLLQQNQDAPVVQRITETAKPEEIPTQPEDLGISNEDLGL